MPYAPEPIDPEHEKHIVVKRFGPTDRAVRALVDELGFAEAEAQAFVAGVRRERRAQGLRDLRRLAGWTVVALMIGAGMGLQAYRSGDATYGIAGLFALLVQAAVIAGVVAKRRNAR